MNLLQLREKFREISGRFDLVNDDFSDNGADFYINEGSKFLDRLDEHQKSWASCFRFIESGFYSASFPMCRAIKEVWIANSENRWRLDKIDFHEIVKTYMNKIPSQRLAGTPLYYSPILTRYIPDEIPAEEFESFIGWVEIPSGNANLYNSIVISAPAEERLLVEIKGLFHSPLLESDDDKNYWSEANPLLLIMSAMRQLEVVNRNTQGVNDWTNSIMTESRQLGMDLVEEIISEADQMRG